MTRLGKASLLAGCFLLFGLVANGQDAGQNAKPQAEYPSTKHYELGYVQPGKGQLCNTLLTDYEEYAPDRMDDYYRTNRFVQWTDGKSSKYSSRYTYVLPYALKWVYVPIFNDGNPRLLVRRSYTSHPFDYSSILGNTFDSIDRQEMPFYTVTPGDLELKNIGDKDLLGKNNKDLGILPEVLSYYSVHQPREIIIQNMYERALEARGKESADSSLARRKSNCRACDFSKEQLVYKRRQYLLEKGFFLSDEAVAEIESSFSELTADYTSDDDDPPLSLIRQYIPNWQKYLEEIRINIVYFEGEFYVYIRKKRSDTTVAFRFISDQEFEEACYIGPKETLNKTLEN